MKNGADSILQAQRPVSQRQLEVKVLPRQVAGADIGGVQRAGHGKSVPDELLERIYEAFLQHEKRGNGHRFEGYAAASSSRTTGGYKFRTSTMETRFRVVFSSFWIPVASPLQASHCAEFQSITW